MNAETLIEVLRELERRGWPLNETAKSRPVGKQHECFALHFPDGSHDVISVNGFDRTTAVLTGFLVSQLEARGLRREVLQYPDGWVCVVLEDSGRYDIADIGDATEIEATLKACLSLPTEATP